MKISSFWGADTGVAWSPLFSIEDPPSRSTQPCLQDLISDVKQGVHVLCLSPAALLEAIGPFPRLHDAWCNSIFFLTARKENQVIKCEKSPAKGALSAWVDFPTQSPGCKSQQWTQGKTAELWTKAWHCPWMHRVPNTVCCQELTSQPCPAQVPLLPIGLKRPTAEGGFGHSAMLYAPSPIVPGLQVLGRRWHHLTRRQWGWWDWRLEMSWGYELGKNVSCSQEQPWSQWSHIPVLASQTFWA